MSRSGYSDDIDTWALIRWRGAVASAIKGKRGQAFLREMAAALDRLPVHQLVRNDLETPDGQVCALGAVGRKRGLDMAGVDPENPEAVANLFGISPALAREIMWLNDDDLRRESPRERFTQMRAWIEAALTTEER